MGTYQGRHALIFAAAPETDYGYIRAFLREHPDALVACRTAACGNARGARSAPGFHDLRPGFHDRGRGRRCDPAETLEKDDTGFRRAVCGEVFRRGCREATLVCATGGRIDHMLANLSLLEEAKTLGGHLTILDPYNRVELHQGGRQEFIMPETFTYFSVVPMDAVLEGVTIENAKYELTNGTVTRVGMISTSNEAKTNSRFAVTIERGTALIIFSRDRVL